MRLLFLILLLCNALAFGFIRFDEGRSGADNQLMMLQIAPEKMVLRKPGAQLAPNPPANPAPAQPQAGASPAKDAVAAQAGLVCIEWGGFTPDQSARARGALEKAGLRDQATPREIPERYWVYIPPLKSSAEIEKKTGELKARGITEFTVVQNDEQWSNAIAFGEFKSDEAANTHLA